MDQHNKIEQVELKYLSLHDFEALKEVFNENEYKYMAFTAEASSSVIKIN